ncbi:hypothetical protein SSAG_00109 [Streptomyces sp. Mg1]|nr:hypothetical protein SSAG_00109 [Streptomyces sp. Mg1]
MISGHVIRAASKIGGRAEGTRQKVFSRLSAVRRLVVRRSRVTVRWRAAGGR